MTLTGATKSHTTLDSIVALETELHTTLERSHDCTIVQLTNIRPQLWYDVTPQKIEWQNQLMTYDATKMESAINHRFKG